MASAKKKYIVVQLLKMGQNVQELRLAAGATLASALAASGLGDQSLDQILEGVRVNGQLAELDHKLKNGELITVSPQVKGGR